MNSMVAVFVLSCGWMGPAGQDDQAKKDLERMQGTWKVQGLTVGGMELPAAQVAKMSFTIKGDEISPNNNPKDVAVLKLDPSHKPATMDLTEKNKKTGQGIYEIEGDTLKMCFNEPGEGRPKEFRSAAGSKTVYLVLKRDKK
jgi:uncharacterized protein (TIGR03067 family)